MAAEQLGAEVEFEIEIELCGTAALGEGHEVPLVLYGAG